MTALALKDYYDNHAQYTATKSDAKRIVDTLTRLLKADYVSHIRQSTIDDYTRTRIASGIKSGSVRRELATLKAALAYNVREGALLTMPVFRLPPQGKPRERVLTPTEANKLLDACQTLHVYAFVMIALNTGQRKGVIENLTWFQVDFERGLIDFRKAKEQNKRGGVVAMNDTLRDMLEDMYRHKETEYVLEWLGKKAGSIRKAFERTASNAGLENVSPHTLRHTAATWMAGQGVPMWQIAQILGHASSATTEKHYAKYTPDFSKFGVNTVESLLKKEGVA